VRPWAAIFFLFLITWQLVFKVSLVALWKINQDYVVANLCENRNKPASTCLGHCVLKKQLKKAEGQHPQQAFPASLMAKLQLSVFILPAALAPERVPAFAALQSQVSFYQDSPAIKLPFYIFHPPEFSV
jgi:hypothetical protein